MPLASKDVHSVPLLLRTEKRFFVLFVHYLFLGNVLFHALRFFDIFFRPPSRWSTFSVSDTHTLLWGFRHIRLSFCPRPFCWCLSGVDSPSGSRSCHTDFCSFRCLCTVYVVRFDLKQKAVGVCVQELAPCQVSSSQCRLAC